MLSGCDTTTPCAQLTKTKQPLSQRGQCIQWKTRGTARRKADVAASASAAAAAAVLSLLLAAAAEAMARQVGTTCLLS